MKLVTVVGARPQFIKAAVVSRALKHLQDIDEYLIHTGQHYDDELSDIFFRELEIAIPSKNLNIGSGLHGQQTAEMLQAIEQILLDQRPDFVLVYGDTNSTLAGALAAAKSKFCLAHVEAGLRSFNRNMPEEINRVLTDHCSDLLFAPTQTAVNNLRFEGLADRTQLVGDVMYDAALQFTALAQRSSNILESLRLKDPYILGTIHRAENTDNPIRLRAIISALGTISQAIPVVLPLHPRTRHAASRFNISLDTSGLTVINPVGYLDMVMLENRAHLIVTDSGGVQKEAYFHRVPCVTVRNETEWTELVSSGWNCLAPPENEDTIVAQIERALESSPEESGHFYGDGQAAEQIVEGLLNSFHNTPGGQTTSLSLTT